MSRVKINYKKPIKIWKDFTKKKKIVTSAIAIIMICAVTGSVLFIQKGKGDELAQATVQQTTVTVGNISNTIVGTGTLETDNSDSITVPSGVIIKEVKVESGDAISKGDTLATVDTMSVLESISIVQKEIEGLDEKINTCKNSSDTETITANVSGTIKKIYVKQGASVTDCIAENGALIILAVDGNTDEKLEITASGGIVSKVHVSKNQSVSAGAALLTIENNKETTEYKQLLAQRKELTANLKKLTEMSKTGNIVADIDGIVGEVNVSEGAALSDGNTTNSSVSGNTTTSGNITGKSVTASQTSYTTKATAQKKGSSSVFLMTLGTRLNNGESESVNNSAEIKDPSADTKIALKVINSGSSTKSSLVLPIPKTGNVMQSEIMATDKSYEGKIVWTPKDTAFKGETTYSADVTLYALEGYVWGIDSITQVQTGILSATTVADDGKTMTFHITFPATTEEQKKQDNTQKQTTENIKQSNQQETDADKEGSTNSIGENGNISANITNDSQLSSGAKTAGYSSGTLTSGNVQNTSSESDDNEESSYANQVIAFTLAPNESMLLSVNVDELDINSVLKGQKAQVTLDAIEDKTFTGTVTKVGNSASSSGNGVAKYIVKIIIPKDDQMKSGMNASATIVVENKENVLTIPVNVLQERGNNTFVYTKQDENGNLSGEVEVKTGLSDGDNVEIIEGLSEGDTVYYQKTGKIFNQSSGGIDGNEKQGGFSNHGEKPEGFSGRSGFGDMPVGGLGQGGN